MTYTFKYKHHRAWHWRKLTGVVGHFYDNQSVEYVDENDHRITRQPQDRMIVYFADGSLKAIRGWSECELELGTDWVLFTKREMEKKAGQPIQLNVNA